MMFFPRLSIQGRLLLLYCGVLVVAFVALSFMVAQVPRNVLSEIDEQLWEITRSTLDAARDTNQVDLTTIELGSDLTVYESASTFFVVTNAIRIVTKSSDNLGANPELLDPIGIDLDPVNGTERFATVGELRVLTTPIFTDDGSGRRLSGYLQVARPIVEFDSIRNLNQIVIFAAAGALFAAVFLIVLLTPSILRPVEEITNLAEKITSADDLGRRISDTGQSDPEIGRLTYAINRLMERLERLFRSQQRLLADVSHELRTPLTAVRGNVDLLRMMGGVDPVSLNAIEAEVSRMTRLVEDLLTLARADGGGLAIQREPVDLDTVFLEVFRQATMLKRPARLVIGELDQACVMGDADRLKQLLLILVDNATKYTPASGTVTLSLSKNDYQTLVTVADTGIGISAEDLPNVFERFYRVDEARTRTTGGSGLGLSIAQSIVAAHDGRISVRSELGVGTEFTVILPLYRRPKRIISDSAPVPAITRDPG